MKNKPVFDHFEFTTVQDLRREFWVGMPVRLGQGYDDVILSEWNAFIANFVEHRIISKELAEIATLFNKNKGEA